jgi:hypothetical protein
MSQIVASCVPEGSAGVEVPLEVDVLRLALASTGRLASLAAARFLSAEAGSLFRPVQFFSIF